MVSVILLNNAYSIAIVETSKDGKYSERSEYSVREEVPKRALFFFIPPSYIEYHYYRCKC